MKPGDVVDLTAWMMLRTRPDCGSECSRCHIRFTSARIHRGPEQTVHQCMLCRGTVSAKVVLDSCEAQLQALRDGRDTEFLKSVRVRQAENATRLRNIRGALEGALGALQGGPVPASSTTRVGKPVGVVVELAPWTLMDLELEKAAGIVPRWADRPRFVGRHDTWRDWWADFARVSIAGGLLGHILTFLLFF